jgi:putative transposase
MPQSLSLVIVHFVWSTKDRYPFINEESRKGLHGYLATICQDLGCHCFEIDGTKDHVHVATTLPRTLSQADLVEDAKKKSSKWFKVEGHSPMATKFAWQRGYAAFSVSQSRLQSVERYIQRQEIHHARINFQDEYRRLLIRHGVEFDERYVWD